MAGAAIANMGVSLTARTAKFNRGMNSARGSLKRFSGGARKAAGATRLLTSAIAPLGAALSGAAIATGLFKAAKASEQFNQSMRSSLAIMGDVSGVLRKDMADAAIRMAAVTKFSASDAAKAYFFLASAGLDAAQSIKALPTVATFAQAGMFDMALATDLLTDAQTALGLSFKEPIRNMREMARLGDILVKANTLANASVQQFSEALTSKAAAKMKTFNISAEEGVAVLAAFADQGIKGAEAGTAFAIVVRDLTSKAIKNAAAFDKFKVSVFDADGNLRNIADIVEDLERALLPMNDEQRKATLLLLGFSDKSVGFQQTLLGSSGKIREMEAALKAAGGTMQEVADKQLSPLAKGWASFSAAVVNAARTMQPAIDDIGRGLKAIGDAALTVQNAPNSPNAALKASKIAITPRTVLVSDLVEAQEALQNMLREFGDTPGVKEFAIHVENLSTKLEEFEFAAEGAVKAQEALAVIAKEEALITPESLAIIKAAENEWASLERQALSFFDATRTPAERLNKTVEDLQTLLGAELIAPETFDRAIAKAREEFKRMVDDETGTGLDARGPDARGPGRVGLRSLSSVGGVSGARSLASAAGRRNLQLAELEKLNVQMRELIVVEKKAKVVT